MTHLLDATAVIDLIAEGPGHGYVASLFPDVQVSAVNWLEVLRWAQQQFVAPEDWAQDLIAYGLDVAPFTIADALYGPALRAAEQQIRGETPGQRLARATHRRHRLPRHRRCPLLDHRHRRRPRSAGRRPRGHSARQPPRAELATVANARSAA